MIYFYIKLNGERPTERSLPFESLEIPELLEGWDVLWSLDDWNDYVNSINIPEILTPETATSISDFYDMDIDSYIYFKTHLKAFVEGLGDGDEVIGFENLNGLEREFVALNGIGSKEQIASVLENPTKQTFDFLISKQLLY